jgi:hypothetical protein
MSASVQQRSHRPIRWGMLALVAALLPLGAAAAPFVPQSDDEVVQRLPQRPNADARLQQQRLSREPANLPLALQLAREAIGRARDSGDPRELGQARAALAPWWGSADPPPTVRLLRATVLQSEHAFDSALADLDALLKDDSNAPLPLRAQAELTRASLHQVQGRYADASAGCQRLLGMLYARLGAAAQFPAQVCLAELKSLQGETQAAHTMLASLADDAPAQAAGWLALVRAEEAERRADTAAAETHYREALAAKPDVYALGAYADWLLDQQREAEVLQLLAARDDADALLLRKAIALRRLGDRRADAAIAALQARFDAARLRGDASHAREEARFELDLRSRPEAALALAQKNWDHQKEPADTRLLLRVAHAAQRPAAAEPVRRFIAQSGFTDMRLAAIEPGLGSAR